MQLPIPVVENLASRRRLAALGGDADRDTRGNQLGEPNDLEDSGGIRYPLSYDVHQNRTRSNRSKRGVVDD